MLLQNSIDIMIIAFQRLTMGYDVTLLPSLLIYTTEVGSDLWA